jgi:hypothetical protein
MKERFDSETNVGFIRFLRYARLSYTEGQSEPYVTLNVFNRESRLSRYNPVGQV